MFAQLYEQTCIWELINPIVYVLINGLNLQSSWLVKKLATLTWPLLTKEMKVLSHSEVITALTVKFPCVSSKPVLVTWLSSV